MSRKLRVEESLVAEQVNSLTSSSKTLDSIETQSMLLTWLNADHQITAVLSAVNGRPAVSILNERYEQSVHVLFSSWVTLLSKLLQESLESPSNADNVSRCVIQRGALPLSWLQSILHTCSETPDRTVFLRTIFGVSLDTSVENARQ